MSFVKYSVGGPITHIDDKKIIENVEEDKEKKEEGAFLATCKCGTQHLLMKEEVRVCCCGKSVGMN